MVDLMVYSLMLGIWNSLLMIMSMLLFLHFEGILLKIPYVHGIFNTFKLVL